MIRDLLTRARFLIFRKNRRELEEEMQFHIEHSIAEKIAAGTPAIEARRQALVEFGSIGGTREECERQRPGWWIGTIAQDIRYAMRIILAHGWFSAAIIATLALGIGLNTMVFILVNAALFKPVPVPGGERLVSISNSSLTRNDTSLWISYPDFQDYKAQSSFFESFEAVSDNPVILSEIGLAPQQFRLERATGGIFSMVDTNAVLGRAFLPTDSVAGAPPVLVIDYEVWQERYAGLPSVIGRQVRLDGKPATIIGVMPRGFHYPNNEALWTPLIPSNDTAKRNNRNLRAYAILKPGVTLRAANTQLNEIARRLASQFPEDKDIGVSVLTFHQRFNGGMIRLVFLLMLAAVGFVLLIACANVANMMLSRSLARQREMSIRTALGASRWRVIRQLLIESVILSTTGGLLGLGLSAGGVHWFDLVTDTIRPNWVQFTMDFTVFGYFAALCILSGVLFGIAPALRSSKPNLNDVLKEGAHSVSRRRGGWLSGGLVVAQFALTLVLLTGAGIFARALIRGLSINPDIPAPQLTAGGIQLPDSRYKDSDARVRFFDEVLPRLRAIPGVSHAGVASGAPGLGAAHQQIELENRPIANPAQRPFVAFVAQSPGYLDVIHLPLLRGRDFSELDGTAHHEAAILTRDAATHFWPGQDPIGKRFRLFDDQSKPSEWITVVGIAADMVQEVRENDPLPLLFVPYRQEGWNGAALVVASSADPTQSMRKAVQSLDPELPLIDPVRLSAAIEKQVWFLNVFGKMFLGFAIIALLMSSVGLYAVIAHATSSRTQEIGVRIALGATIRSILMLVMRRGLWQITVGLVLGLCAALPLGRMMTILPLGISPSQPSIVFLVALTLASVGIFACWLPARRASTLDPVKAIRYE